MTTHADEHPARLAHSGALIWLTWVVANFAAGLGGPLLAGMLLTFLLPATVASSSFGLDWIILRVLLGGTLVLIFLPLCVAQGLVLRWVIPGFDRQAILHWVQTTAMACGGAGILSAILFGFYFLLGQGLGESLGYNSVASYGIGLSYLVITGVGIGGILGFSQSALLRHYVFAPDIWLKATLLAWGLAVPLGVFVLVGWLPSIVATVDTILETVLGFHVANLLIIAVVSALSAAVTGLTLPRLMTPPVRRLRRLDVPRLFTE